MPLKILDKDFDFAKIDTWNTLIGFVGFIITVITLVVSNNARKAVNKLQKAYSFEKRISEHLDLLSKYLSDLNKVLNSLPNNAQKAQVLVSNILAELSSLANKVDEKNVKKLILKSRDEAHFFLKNDRDNESFLRLIINKIIITKKDDSTDEEILWKIYLSVNQVHKSLINLHKDQKNRIQIDE